LVGRTFLAQEQEDGTRFRKRISEKIEEMENGEKRIKFLVRRSESDQEEILSYDELINLIADQYDQEANDGDTLWTFKCIMGHEGPLKPTDPSYKGCKYNVLVQWEDGSTTMEPLNVIGADDPVTCAEYARDNDLLDVEGWKRFRRLVKNAKVFTRMLNQAKLKSVRRGPIFKYGFEVPRSFKHAMELDKANGNSKWFDAIKTEATQIKDYGTFKDIGLGTKVPDGFKLIRCHFVFDVKHDGRHKARYVAGGHMTDPPLDSVYSGVVTLRSLRLLIFLAELNGFSLWAGDVGNAYLEALTKEKIVIIAGPEFRIFGWEGHMLIIIRALYGLKTSGARWHERFADTLREEGFVPSKADADVWMRRAGDRYEYIGVYVDDLAIAMEDPAAFCEILKTKHNYKLKGDGPLAYHLGCDFGRDPDGMFSYGPLKYVDKMMDTYQRFFNDTPKEVRSALEKGDHPELDTTELCSDKIELSTCL
jgi:Reverse transcriptase (RNA-dependent DNA polymerase)